MNINDFQCCWMALDPPHKYEHHSQGAYGFDPILNIVSEEHARKWYVTIFVGPNNKIYLGNYLLERILSAEYQQEMRRRIRDVVEPDTEFTNRNGITGRLWSLDNENLRSELSNFLAEQRLKTEDVLTITQVTRERRHDIWQYLLSLNDGREQIHYHPLDG